MRKILRTAVALSASALVLAGCSANDGGDGGTSAEGLKGTGSGDSCVIEGTVPVGAALSLTGGAASYGESQQKGLELALADLNAKDGVKYDLKVEDDGSDPRQAISVFETFVGNGTSLIIGPTLSNTAFQAQPVAQEAGVPVLAISNTATGITAQGDFIFRDSLTEAQVIPQTIQAASEKLGLKKVVVMYSNDDAFTESGFEVMESALKDQGIEVLDTLKFSVKDTDFRSLLTAAKEKNPDAIVVSALIEAAIPLVTQARELGINEPIIGGNGFNNPALMKDAGQAAEDVIVGAAWNSASDSPENTAFMKAFEEKYGAGPDQFAAQAYTGMLIVDHAVRANCSGERTDVQQSLTEVKDLATPLGSISINKDRDAEHPAVVQIVKDGKFTVLN
ncbi:Leucine-, isoleucine-, valine-, threonine-, and alanine-binding protein [Microbacterium esteraromaticum]|uniref:Leucine-, isoleucine-, valine-, threonine-, and alanine-binding protein n=1 Tax=Microbacterium esteraromaticum TaxID=57043 RepID=A0A1R4J991_9MICO|nr:ABC transporter substrate-binding protein [Microbacterium esteraromaticum]SJN28690.1 Leucine-, isoleucine-, valine-, threonine-, and alanine-binding protein [Microbacterium esteraromaticum]